MKIEYDDYRVCPKCKSTDVILDVKALEGSIIEEVEVHCKACNILITTGLFLIYFTTSIKLSLHNSFTSPRLIIHINSLVSR